jgi:hypothetical protein
VARIWRRMEYNIKFILNVERKSFISSFNKIMMKNYFKKRGNKWINIKDDITKIIMLQKSRFGNNYYINYGYNINDLELDSTNMHIENRLHIDYDLQRVHIWDLLNLDNEIDDNQRIQEIELILNKYIFSEMSRINSVNDIKMFLGSSLLKRNDIPKKVKQFFSMN